MTRGDRPTTSSLMVVGLRQFLTALNLPISSPCRDPATATAGYFLGALQSPQRTRQLDQVDHSVGAEHWLFSQEAIDPRILTCPRLQSRTICSHISLITKEQVAEGRGLIHRRPRERAFVHQTFDLPRPGLCLFFRAESLSLGRVTGAPDLRAPLVGALSLVSLPFPSAIIGCSRLEHWLAFRGGSRRW